MLGYAIIGCGYVSGRHVEAAINLPDTRVAVLCDVDEGAAKATAEKYGLTCPIVTDYREAVQRDDVHVVVAGVPTHLHCEVGTAAAEAGKHVYMEKPLAQTLVEARELIAACERCEVNMVVGHSHRYFPVLKRARELVLEGAIGKIVKVRAVQCYHQNFGTETRAWKLDSSWPLHGALLDVGVHAADDLHFVTDSQTVRLYAEGECARPDETSIFDVGTAVLRLANGAVAEWEVSESQLTGGKLPCQSTTEVYGTRGAMMIDGDTLTVYIGASGDQPEECREERLSSPHFFMPWQELHRDFVDSILNGTPVPIAPVAGYRALQVIDAVFASVREHIPMAIPDCGLA